MNSTVFVKNAINQLVALLPTIKCRYEYKDYSDTHMIEVLPLSVYNSAAFEEAAEPLLMEFIGQFPGESLCFISEESLSSIETSIHGATGSEYHSTEREDILYQVAKPSSIAKKRVEVRVNLDFYKGLAEKITPSGSVSYGNSDYAMAA